MCGLAGFTQYGTKKLNKKAALIRGLLKAAAVRGKHATGISYNYQGKHIIMKAAVPADKFRIQFTSDTEPTAVMGHTRHTTQGTEKNNQNNHPFPGSVPTARFSFAHNGVLDNDRMLQSEYSLPKTDIATDSYVAVQLLEQLGSLSLENIARMAELVSGVFTFTLLDHENTLTIIKNDSPLHLVHLPKLETYVYGSTKEIVEAGLKAAGISNTPRTEIVLKAGDILQITADGTLVHGNFEPQEFYYNPRNWKYAAASSRTVGYGRYDLEEALYDAGLSTAEIDLMQEHYTESSLWTAAYDTFALESMLFEVLRDEFRWSKRHELHMV